ncbi:MAG: MFS transporter [Muribaculaceae bacterium]|nr:MFS transporter [Muribaculaceae bacterium]
MEKKYSTKLVFMAACVGMSFFGVTMLSLGPILGPLNAVVEGANALPSTMSIGIIIGTILFGPIVDKFGYKSLLILASICALAGVQGLANFADIKWLHCSIFSLGFGGGILNGLTNALVSDIYDDKKRGGRLGLLGAFYCVGALLWTLLNYFIPDFRIPLGAMSIVMVLFIVAFFFIAFPQAKPQGSVSVKKSLGLLKYPALLLFAVVLFFQCAFEGTSGNFTVQYLNHMGGMDNATATLAMTCYTIGMMGGRLPLGRIMGKLKELGTLYLYLSVAFAGVILFYALADSVVAAYVAMALIGFGAGATFPVVLNFIGGAFKDLSGTAFSIALFIGLCGQSIGNSFMGMQFDSMGYIALPITLIACVVVMVMLVPLAVKFTKK